MLLAEVGTGTDDDAGGGGGGKLCSNCAMVNGPSGRERRRMREQENEREACENPNGRNQLMEPHHITSHHTTPKNEGRIEGRSIHAHKTHARHVFKYTTYMFQEVRKCFVPVGKHILDSMPMLIVVVDDDAFVLRATAAVVVVVVVVVRVVVVVAVAQTTFACCCCCCWTRMMATRRTIVVVFVVVVATRMMMMTTPV